MFHHSSPIRYGCSNPDGRLQVCSDLCEKHCFRISSCLCFMYYKTKYSSLRKKPMPMVTMPAQEGIHVSSGKGKQCKYLPTSNASLGRELKFLFSLGIFRVHSTIFLQQAFFYHPFHLANYSTKSTIHTKKAKNIKHCYSSYLEGCVHLKRHKDICFKHKRMQHFLLTTELKAETRQVKVFNRWRNFHVDTKLK